MSRLRNLGAVLFGTLIGSALNMILIVVNSRLFDAPDDLDFNDQPALIAWLETLPPTAYVLPLVAHLVQAAVGGWIAARLGASSPRLLAAIVAGLTLVGGVVNLLSLPAPWWMWLEVPLYGLIAWGVGSLEARRRERAG